MKANKYSEFFIERTAEDYNMTHEQVKRIYEVSENDKEFFDRLEALKRVSNYELK